MQCQGMSDFQDRELEGHKEIGEELKVSHATAKRYGLQGTAHRVPLPTYANYRGRRCIMLSTALAWKAGGIYAREPATPIVAEPKTLRTGAPLCSSASGAAGCV